MSQVAGVSPLVEIDALEDAVGIVGRAHLEFKRGTDLEDKVWRVKKYLILRQNILFSFLSADDEEMAI